MAKRTCNCENPPGGGISCDESQFAICRVTFGVCRGECLSIPEKPGEFKSERQYARFLNTLVFRITGDVRFAKSLEIIEASDILRQGVYKNPVTGDVVKFTVPPEWKF